MLIRQSLDQTQIFRPVINRLFKNVHINSYPAQVNQLSHRIQQQEDFFEPDRRETISRPAPPHDVRVELYSRCQSVCIVKLVSVKD